MGIVKFGMKMVVNDVVVNYENEIRDKRSSDGFVKVICLGDSVVGKLK